MRLTVLLYYDLLAHKRSALALDDLARCLRADAMERGSNRETVARLKSELQKNKNYAPQLLNFRSEPTSAEQGKTCIEHVQVIYRTEGRSGNQQQRPLGNRIALGEPHCDIGALGWLGGRMMSCPFM